MEIPLYSVRLWCDTWWMWGVGPYALPLAGRPEGGADALLCLEAIVKLSLVLVSLLLWNPPSLAAQDGPGIEVGTRAGLSILLNGGEVMNFAVPGGAPSALSSFLGGNSSVHVAFFPGDRMMLEPQLSFSVLNISNGDSETFTTLGLSGQLAYLFEGAETNSPYVGFNSAFFNISNGDSESDFAIGGNVGYRFAVSEGAVLRLEGAYRRWFDLEVNEINAALILGVLFD